MSPCKKGSRGARAAISEGGWGLRRGSPLGDSSSSSQGKGWELVNNPGTPGTGMLIISPWTDTTKLLTRSCSPRVGGSDNWTASCLVVLGEGGGGPGLLPPAARESHTALHIFHPQHWSQGLWTVQAENSVLCVPRRRGCGLRPGEGTVLCVCLGGGHCRGTPQRTHPSPEQCSSQ